MRVCMPETVSDNNPAQFLSRLWRSCWDSFVKLETRLDRLIQQRILVPLCRPRWHKKYVGLIEAREPHRRTGLERLQLNKGQFSEIERQLCDTGEVQIATIDRDGLFLSHIGPLRVVPETSEEAFLAREPNYLSMVYTHEGVTIKKSYRPNADRFLKELKVLSALNAAGCNVPELIAADFEQLTLTMSFVRGCVLREEMAQQGALLRDKDISRARSFQVCGKEANQHRINEGKRFLYKVVDSKFVQQLRAQLGKLHEAGVIWGDVKWGNVVIEKTSGEPYLLDFELAHYYPSGNHILRWLSKKEVEKFDRYFG